ncbi:hypothetical protein [Sulfurimonas sp.]|uniref:hypothetical protein n=1 Tax=Sulfurimonas sp. TaxID=2022749 RepID=UPI00356794D3
MVEKFRHAIKKEILYYLLILLILALVMHSDLLNDPVARLQTMSEKGNYTHPFLYAFAIYATILIFRKIIDFVVGIFEKKSN